MFVSALNSPPKADQSWQEPDHEWGRNHIDCSSLQVAARNSWSPYGGVRTSAQALYADRSPHPEIDLQAQHRTHLFSMECLRWPKRSRLFNPDVTSAFELGSVDGFTSQQCIPDQLGIGLGVDHGLEEFSSQPDRKILQHLFQQAMWDASGMQTKLLG